jgi:formamidopyrimidine-DNA glycosylase
VTLAPRVLGRRITGLTVHRPETLRSHSPAAAARILVGQSFREVTRRGKALLFALDGGWTLAFHFALWGVILVKSAPADDAHAAVVIELDEGSRLEFRELQLSNLNLYRTADLTKVAYLSSLGPDPLDRSITPARFRQLLAGRGAVRNLLTDQERLAGIGNLWALEILFAAKVRPARTAQGFTTADWQRLHRAMRSVLRRGVRAGGEPEFPDATGRTGRFRLAVYGRAGQPCRVCGTPIRAGKVGGRPTFFCPRCQK